MRGAQLLCHRQASSAPRYPSQRKADSSGQLARQLIIRAEAKRPGAGAAVQGLHAAANPPAYAVTEIDISDLDAYQKEYVPLAQASIRASGGHLMAAGQNVVGLEGSSPAARVAINKFDSIDAARAWRKSDQYKEARKVGDKHAKFRALALEGLPQFPWAGLTKAPTRRGHRAGQCKRDIGQGRAASAARRGSTVRAFGTVRNSVREAMMMEGRESSHGYREGTSGPVAWRSRSERGASQGRAARRRLLDIGDICLCRRAPRSTGRLDGWITCKPSRASSAEGPAAQAYAEANGGRQIINQISDIAWIANFQRRNLAVPQRFVLVSLP
jgi:uncharacterized protein (DUF1330 family)